MDTAMSLHLSRTAQLFVAHATRVRKQLVSAWWSTVPLRPLRWLSVLAAFLAGTERLLCGRLGPVTV